MSSTDLIRAVIAGPSTFIRYAIREALTGRDDIAVVGEASSSREAAREVRQSGADVLIYDASEATTDALACLVMIRRQAPRTRVLLLADNLSDETTFRAISMGVSEVLRPEVTQDELIRSVRRVGTEQTASGPAMFRDRRGLPLPLSDQEMSIVRAIAEGWTDRQIAAGLAVSVATVKTHVRSILRKTGARNRTGAIATAFRIWVLK